MAQIAWQPVLFSLWWEETGGVRGERARGTWMVITVIRWLIWVSVSSLSLPQTISLILINFLQQNLLHRGQALSSALCGVHSLPKGYSKHPSLEHFHRKAQPIFVHGQHCPLPSSPPSLALQVYLGAQPPPPCPLFLWNNCTQLFHTKSYPPWTSHWLSSLAHFQSESTFSEHWLFEEYVK